MRSRTVVTFSTVHGAKEYRLTAWMRKWIILFFVSIVILLSSGFLLSYWFQKLLSENMSKQQQLVEEKQRLIEDKQKLDEDLEAIQAEIVNKNIILEELEQSLTDYKKKNVERIDEMEKFIGIYSDSINGLENGENATDESFDARLNSVKHSILQRSYFLSSIPNGLPMKSYRYISSGYGIRLHPVSNKRGMHYGIDYVVPMNTPVYATADGVVSHVSHSKRGYGKLIRLTHNFGFISLYAHLNKILVKSGDYVYKGDLIAKSGNTGISTGPHLHYEVLYMQKKLNPSRFVKWSLKNYDTLFEKETHVPWRRLLKIPKILTQ